LVCATALVGVLPLPTAIAQSAQVQHVKMLPSTGAVEIEIQMNQPVAPRTQVVASPDRLVIDFPGTTPGAQLRALPVNRGDVLGVRVGLFESQPPTTRVVLDLKNPTAYQVFPSGKSVMIKLGGAPAPAVNASNPAPEAPPEPPRPAVTVGFQNGLLSITAEKATLAQVLYEIHTQTGAEIAVPAGAEQEQVAAALGPAPPKDVLSALLNGSSYNFILVGSSSNPNVLERVLLSQKGTSMVLDVPVPQGRPQPGTNPGLTAYMSPGRMVNRGNPNGQPPQSPEEEINNLPQDEDPQPTDPQPGDQQAQPQPPPQN
jgi:hypothetical protein